MTLTRRGKASIAAGAAVAVLGSAVGVLALTGNTPAIVRKAMDTFTGGGEEEAPAPTCPLTGRLAPGGEIPRRPALAIKVENSTTARPQSGLQKADVVYEEPVEGGVTRFIVIYHCRDADRVGPVRSGRTTDADVLVQFGKPLIGYAGGANKVEKAISRARLVDVSYVVAASAYQRDASRPAPHNLYTSTEALYDAGRKEASGVASAVFTYSDEVQDKSKRAKSVYLPFSWSSDVYWRWSKDDRAWMRFHGDEAHVLEDGEQVSAANVVVQLVKVSSGEIVDAAGNPSPVVEVTGRGKAYVLRDGRVIAGRWERSRLGDLTRFVTRSGDEIRLRPGTTWVELLPSTADLEID